MFALANMVHFFTHKLPGLRRGRFSLAFVAEGPFERLLLRHGELSLGSMIHQSACSGPGIAGDGFGRRAGCLALIFPRRHQLRFCFKPVFSVPSGNPSTFLEDGISQFCYFFVCRFVIGVC